MKIESRADILKMGKKYKNLFNKIVSMENLYVAFHKAAKSNKSNESYLMFKANLHANMIALQRDLAALAYTTGQPFTFPVREPKHRIVSEYPFRDRVAEHAVCNVIEPIFDKVFLPQSYACRKNKGTHAAARDVQAELRRMSNKHGILDILKTDWSKYFPSVDKFLVFKELKRKISCRGALAIIEKMISPKGLGIEIGRLISQLAANIKGHIIDRWLVHTVKFKKFFRYMDDIVFIGLSRQSMLLLKKRLEHFAKNNLGLSYSHWAIQKASAGVNFVGYRIWATHKLLRKDSVVRAKRKLKKLPPDKRERFLASWLGHASHADTYNLLNRMELV